MLEDDLVNVFELPEGAGFQQIVPFDCQAADFDLRAGLPPDAARRIAAALAKLVPTGSGVVLDLGAGTGQIGEHLARGWGARGLSRYLGIDISAPMLAVFRRKLGRGGAAASLVQADAGLPWPIASGTIRLLFLSRAAHLLPPAVLVDEALRVASPIGSVIVFGRVSSDPRSLRAVLRRQMRRLLAEHGVEARQAGKAQRKLAAALAERGSEFLPVQTAASWTIVHRASDALAAWRAKAGLAGRAVTPEMQESVLNRLEDWIRKRYGSLDVERDATERYQLAAIRLPKSLRTNLGAKA